MRNIILILAISALAVSLGAAVLSQSLSPVQGSNGAPIAGCNCDPDGASATRVSLPDQIARQTGRASRGRGDYKYTIAHASTNDFHPSELRWLINRGTVIATGTITAKVREAHSPPASKDIFQHTIFSFTVERYIRKGPVESARILLIRQNQGHLPWIDPDGARGIGLRVDGEPMLQVGTRYVLFLRSELDGTVFKDADNLTPNPYEAAEFRLVHPRFAIWPIVKGEVSNPVDNEIPPFPSNRFDAGKQLLGVSERVAEELIREAINKRFQVPESQQRAREQYMRSRDPRGSYKPAEEVGLADR